GTVDLLAGVRVQDGRVCGMVRLQHRSREFCELLALIDEHTPASAPIGEWCCPARSYSAMPITTRRTRRATCTTGLLCTCRCASPTQKSSNSAPRPNWRRRWPPSARTCRWPGVADGKEAAGVPGWLWSAIGSDPGIQDPYAHFRLLSHSPACSHAAADSAF